LLIKSIEVGIFCCRNLRW